MMTSPPNAVDGKKHNERAGKDTAAAVIASSSVQRYAKFDSKDVLYSKIGRRPRQRQDPFEVVGS